MYWYLPWVWTVSFMEAWLGGADVVAAPLTDTDLDAAAELHSEAFDHAWSGEELAALLSAAGGMGVVARRVGQPLAPPLGFVLARNAGGEAEILTIAVARSARNAGVGRLLMDQLLQQLYAERAESLFLEVDEDNIAARSLYRRLRFEEVGRRPAYYRHPNGHRSNALTLRRNLR